MPLARAVVWPSTSSAWRRAGYLDVTVEPESQFSDDRTEVVVRFVVEPGPRTMVESVVVAGLRQTQEVTVAREIDLRPGEPFSFERVLESQRRRRFMAPILRAQGASWDYQPPNAAGASYIRNSMPIGELERRARFPAV